MNKWSSSTSRNASHRSAVLIPRVVIHPIDVRIILLTLLALTVGLAGCKSEQSPKPSVAETGIIPSYEQRAGSAESGWQALTNEPIVSCGLPMSVIEQTLPAREFDVPGRASDNGLPYFLNRITDSNGVELAASNCLVCHATPLFGELVVGLGNEFLDFTGNPSTAVEQSGLLVTGNDEISAWEKYANRIAAIAPYVQTESVGVNPANNLTFALMAHRDPETMAWSDTPLLAPPPAHVPPVSVPPWWRMKKKHAMFSMGEGRGDHASFMMTAAILCTDNIAELEQLNALAGDIRAFIESVEPPVYPFDIDDTLAQKGKALFEQTCSQCHGQYGDSESYPNRLVAIDIVGTDSALVDYALAEGQQFVDWFNRSPFGDTATALPGRGYVAPPLDGIWSTAPYLHNGSVPTVRALLNSAVRPERWRMATELLPEKSDYNQADLGWSHLVVHDDDENSEQAGDHASSDTRWYDTSRYGYGNGGHRFGDALSDAERSAVIEYLKTL